MCPRIPWKLAPAGPPGSPAPASPLVARPWQTLPSAARWASLRFQPASASAKPHPAPVSGAGLALPPAAPVTPADPLVPSTAALGSGSRPRTSRPAPGRAPLRLPVRSQPAQVGPSLDEPRCAHVVPASSSRNRVLCATGGSRRSCSFRDPPSHLPRHMAPERRPRPAHCWKPRSCRSSSRRSRLPPAARAAAPGALAPRAQGGSPPRAGRAALPVPSLLLTSNRGPKPAPAPNSCIACLLGSKEFSRGGPG